MKMRTKIIGVLLVCFPLAVSAQQEEENIAAGDILHITVYGEPGLDQKVQVSGTGDVEFVPLGQVPVAGLSPVGAGEKIERELKNEFYLDAEVSVIRNRSAGESTQEPLPYFSGEDSGIPSAEDDLFYRVGPYDTIEISVYGEPDLSKTVKVSEVGNIRFPLLGDVQVEGLTAEEIARKIEELLEDEYLVNPQVSVMIEEYGKVYVFGAVNQPGEYELKGPLTLVDILVLAGGAQENANLSKVKVVRRTGGDRGYVVDVDDVGNRFYLKPLDKVIVEEYGEIYIVGAVENPGAYNLETSDLTPLDAIIFLAGGAAENANLTAVTVIRSAEDGKEEIVVDTSRPDQEFYLQEGDRVVVTLYEDVSVFGEVREPGNYPYKKGITVIDAISQAGGFTEVASKNGVRVIRQQGGEKKIIKVPVGYILKTGDKERDIELQEGDAVVVPESWF
ncbi:MAG: hypothetical protein GF333_01700 [Candidatus Omnitrophica bacterium]|nr:hypothetical protein [Candidatus Omnitrophota bacterium]